LEDPGKQAQNAKAREAELYRQIGQLKVELDWLKKKSAPHIVEIGYRCSTVNN
jgi:hypothetical protein